MITEDILALFSFWFIAWSIGFGFGFKLQAFIRLVQSSI